MHFICIDIHARVNNNTDTLIFSYHLSTSSYINETSNLEKLDILMCNHINWSSTKMKQMSLIKFTICRVAHNKGALRALSAQFYSSFLLLLGRFRLFSNMKNTLPGSGNVVFAAFSFMHSCSRSSKIRRSSSSSSVLPTVVFPGICSTNDAWNINELQSQK